MEVIKEVINPAFKANELPEITVRIGLAYGYALVVLYGKSLDKANIDIIGPSISLASKIASVAKPNQILIGEAIYNIFKSSSTAATHNNISNYDSSSFREINLDPMKWKYLSRSDPESMYRVYEYLEN